MPRYMTRNGWVEVDNWGYQLQGRNGQMLSVEALSRQPHDMLVIDATGDGTNATRFSRKDVSEIQDGPDGRRLVASYIAIGEASDFRDYWDKDWTTTGKATGKLTSEAPDWLGPVNPNWPENRKVRYWDEDWQNTLFNDKRTGDFDKIVKAGFDAAYLDIVDAYYFWGTEVKKSDRQQGDPKNDTQAADRMVDFIVSMTEHAREKNDDFFVIPQNGAWIIDALKDGGKAYRDEIADYYSVIGGIGIEDLYFRGGDKDENNAFRPDEDTIRILKRDFLAHDIPVYVTDYITGDKRIAKFEAAAAEDGFIPYAAPDRDLDRMGDAWAV
ncbi:uncharacterized protein (TIGR01370 family) [Rhizobium sp. SG_E_25_P2]|uniref:endo alpha-1,4 polygalactosaminidase n=1 Tax=Rhizobium sp. SG_E_25_P2 TaxID=2879942 RepID=UPI002475BB0B|nr:endo alpha-1,4 polygalactosaminidase [Rhizobium sp. SG_E_25_P2]MDH6267972.1 uncharacterized protein (TIGR01370 family) [Rhizobium sp. SG_E_25_P2]